MLAAGAGGKSAAVKLSQLLILRFLIYFRLAVGIRGLDLSADEYIVGG